ncbi:MAG: hypothetical protein ABW224_23130 [Kibdelosporangium sp.]
MPIRPGRSSPRRFGREAVLVVLTGCVISMIFNWPIVRQPRDVVMGGIGDPLLQAWEMAWNGNLLTADRFWTANIFYPSADNFAFSDSLLGYLPLSLFGDGQRDAVLRYNLAFLVAGALAFVGAYLLARQLGANWQGAALAGVVFAWAPWRFVHNGHLNVLSTGGIALALFALARGHGCCFGKRPELRVIRPWWALAGWLIAAWQVTIGFAIGIPFVYLMGAIGVLIVVISVFGGHRFGRRLHAANAVGMVVFLGVTLVMTLPYLRVVDRYGFTRNWAEVAGFSPTPSGYLTTSGQSLLWRGTFFTVMSNVPEPGRAEKMLFPGLVVVLIALAGLVFSGWRKSVRISLAAATSLVGILALGAGFLDGAFTYRLLWANLPGWEALRTPGRLILWVLLLLGLLAAGAVTRLGERLAERDRSPTRRRRRLVAFLLLLPAIGALAESVPDQTYAQLPEIPAELRTVFRETRDPILLLPIGTEPDYVYELWSTEGFPLIANGNSGNFPPSHVQISRTMTTFPDNYSLAVLEKYGIRKVIIQKRARESYRFAEAITRDLTGLRVTRTVRTEIVVFDLR